MTDRQIINPGDVLETWCSACGHATPHKYQPADKIKLACVVCHSEAKAESEAEA